MITSEQVDAGHDEVWCTHTLALAWSNGPTRTRTWNQGIRVIREFLPGADYLFARSFCWWGAGRSSLSSRAL